MTTKLTIGKLIHNEVLKQQLDITKFAKLINTTRGNAYNIFERSSIDIRLLKQISKVLNHNFFKDLAEDLDLINDNSETEEDLNRSKAVSQFLNVVPEILSNINHPSTIVFTQPEGEYKDCPLPDFGLAEPFITFTVGETIQERMNENELLDIEMVNVEKKLNIEICTIKHNGLKSLNIPVHFYTSKEWEKLIMTAFDLVKERKIIESWNNHIF